MRGRAETAKPPIAMQNTKIATTLANVKGDEPSASPPIRLATVWRVIRAEPARSAAAQYAAAPAPLGAGSGATGVEAGAESPRRRPPSANKRSPARRFTQPIIRITQASPSAGRRKKLAHSAPTQAPSVFHAYTKAW